VSCQRLAAACEVRRDLKRIDPMIDALREVCHRYPDLRLTQLIVNLTGKVARQARPIAVRSAASPLPTNKRASRSRSSRGSMLVGP